MNSGMMGERKAKKDIIQCDKTVTPPGERIDKEGEGTH